MRIERAPPAGGPLAAALRVAASVGLLGIELPTRRRNRINGFVSACDTMGFTVSVQQAFGNCPQYIQQRTYAALNVPPIHLEISAFANLDDEEARALLSEADTIFVASFAPGPDGRPAMDISHRGGKPGFIRIDEDRCLTIPDFPGNRFFNTLGNILLTDMAGLVVPRFASGDIVLLTGEARLDLGDDASVEAGAIGAERLWKMRPQQGRWLRGALPIELQLKSWSSQTLATGDWQRQPLPASKKL